MWVVANITLDNLLINCHQTGDLLYPGSRSPYHNIVDSIPASTHTAAKLERVFL